MKTRSSLRWAVVVLIALAAGAFMGFSIGTGGTLSPQQMLPKGQAAAAAGLTRDWPKLGPRSTKWAPLVLSTCTEGMPRHFAPCLVGGQKDPDLIYGEELLYPDFSIPEPGFLSDEDATWWRQQATPYATDRFWLRDGRAYFISQLGSNLVMRNVAFHNNPASDMWSESACMAAQVSHRGFTHVDEGAQPTWKGRAVLANSPDSWSLQHFLDRVTKILIQSEGWRINGTHVVSGGSPRFPHVENIWAALVRDRSQEEVHSMSEFSVEELVFPCRTPLIHPFFHERLRELLGVPDAAPAAERKTILYLSRNQDSSGNGGRRVDNEDAVLEAIRGVLQERNKGEQLVIFNKADYPAVGDLAAYFAKNVSAVVGPHGGAWYNAMFLAAPNTFMLEFLPKQRFGVLVWEEASMVGQRVTVLPCESLSADHNIAPDPALIAKALRERLDGASAPHDEPKYHYKWDLSQVQRRL